MNKPSFNGQEFFSSIEHLVKMEQLEPLFNKADIIHFHWIVGMLEYAEIPKILGKKPIVWTTGDMNPFTGGCHYSQGCEGFMSECLNCPQISSSDFSPHDAWMVKKKAYDLLNIHVVCPSQHIANMVKKSSLLGDKPITVIPNAYPIDRIFPLSSKNSRIRLKLPQDKKILLFGAESNANLRKGGDLFNKVINILHKKALTKDIEIAVFGNGKLDVPIKVHYLGSLSEDMLKVAYSAADVFISLSREDVGPMTVVESLLSGTPVIGFSIGVLPDVVIHESTGYCVKPFNIDDILTGIQWALETVENNVNIHKLCHSTAKKYGDPETAAKRHLALYQKIRLIN